VSNLNNAVSGYGTASRANLSTASLPGSAQVVSVNNNQLDQNQANAGAGSAGGSNIQAQGGISAGVQQNGVDINGAPVLSAQSGITQGNISTGGSQSGVISVSSTAGVLSAAQTQSGTSATITSNSSPSNLALSLITLPSGNNGLFKTNTAPGSNYLIETNLAFIDLSKFLGSSYFLNRIGYVPPSNQKLLGDAFYDTKFVNQQIFEKTGKKYIEQGMGTDLAQMQKLMDNAVTEKSSLSLAVGIELSATQVAALSSDIIWPVLKTINGQEVLVPVLYLASATLEGLGSPAIISAGNDINIAATDSITNTGAINAGHDVSLTAGNDITNTGGLISAGNNVNLTATNGNIINQAVVNTSTSGSAYIRQSLAAQGNITAGGNANLNAGNDVSVLASIVTAAGNVNMTAGNDVNVESASLHNRTESYGKKWSSVSDTVNNVASNITAGGDVTVNAANNVNITGSNLQAENASITAQAGDVNIKNAVNSDMSYTASSKKGVLSAKSDKVYDYQETALASVLTINNDLAISAALGDVNIQGSNLDVKNNLNLGDFTIAKNPDGSFKTNANGTYETISGDSVKNVNITTADLKSEHWEEHKSSGFNLNSLKFVQTTSKSATSNTTAVASNVNVGGDLNVNATDNVTVKGSNISVGGDANINADTVDIKSAQADASSSKEEKKIELGKLDVKFENGQLKAGVEGTGTENKYQEQSTTQQASNITVGKNLVINSQGDTNVIASNIAVTGDATIKTGGDFNLSDAQDTKKTNTENSKLEVEVGGKVGNAYVDVGYAAKALADAVKALGDAKNKLAKMQSLKEQGRASDKAVKLAYTQVALATANVANATTSLTLATAGAATAASSSYGSGMYGAVYMDTTAHTDFTKTDSSQSVGSTLITGGNIGINTANNFNMTGSLLASNNGDVSINAKEANITAGESTYQTDFGSKTVTASVSYGNNAVGMSAGYNQADNYTLSNTHTNSQIVAENGTFSLTTSGDTNIKGGNVTADKVALNVGGDLNLETIQDTYEQQGSSFGISVAGGKSLGGNGVAGAPKGGIPPSLQNVGISAGATDIYSSTTGQATGIVELSSNNSGLSEAQNLNNLLNSSSVNVAGKIDNQTVKQDIVYTDADFQGSLTVPTALLTESGRKEIGDAYKNFGKNLDTASGGAAGALTKGYDAVANKISAVVNPVPDSLKGNNNYSDAYTAAIRAGATPEQAQKVVQGLQGAIDAAVQAKQDVTNGAQSEGGRSINIGGTTTSTKAVKAAVQIDDAIQQFSQENPDLAYLAMAATKPSITGLVQVGGGMLFKAFFGDATNQAIKDNIADPAVQSSNYNTPQKIASDAAQGYTQSDSEIASTSDQYNHQLNAITNLTNIVLGTVGNVAIGKVAGSVSSDTRIGYHATTPEAAQSITDNGFKNGTNPGRLGSGGVYVNNTSEGALSEFYAQPGRSPDAPVSVLAVKYKPGTEAVTDVAPVGHRDSFPFSADSITAPSVQNPATTNTIILNGTAVPIK
jgi:hypothetical protein